MAFDEAIDKESKCKLEFFVNDELSWNMLSRITLPTMSSRQLTFMNGGSPEDRAAEFEEKMLQCGDFPAWKMHVKDIYVPWLNDKKLFDFIWETQGDKNSLKEAINVGFW